MKTPMKAQEIMTTEVLTVNDDQTLNEAAQIMWEHDCGSVPVVSAENGNLVGMVTDRDIAMASYTRGACLFDIPVSAACSKNAIFVSVDDQIGNVEQCMQSNQIRRVPVVDENAKLVGIVSLNDIALASSYGRSGIGAKEVASTLAAICQKPGSGRRRQGPPRRWPAPSCRPGRARAPGAAR